MQKKDGGPIFIVGAPRSGTTLLQFMLRCHPRLFFPTGESHFFIPLYKSEASFGDFGQLENVRAALAAMYRHSRAFLEEELPREFDLETLAQELHGQGRRDLRGIIAGLYELNARGARKARWGEKTPYYVLHMDKLQRWFPDAKFIHLIRDGRDVALSLFARQDDFGIYNTYCAARYWEHYVQVGRKLGRELSEGTYLEIRYEELVHDPRKSVRRICAFLNEEYSEAVVNFKTTREPGKTPLLQMPVQADNTGKWRRQLNALQVQIFEGAAGEMLAACGYLSKVRRRRLPLGLRAGMVAHNRLKRWYRRKAK